MTSLPAHIGRHPWAPRHAPAWSSVPAVGDAGGGVVTLEELRGPRGLPPDRRFTVRAFAEWYGVTESGARVVLNRARQAGLVVAVGSAWRRSRRLRWSA